MTIRSQCCNYSVLGQYKVQIMTIRSQCCSYSVLGQYKVQIMTIRNKCSNWIISSCLFMPHVVAIWRVPIVISNSYFYCMILFCVVQEEGWKLNRLLYYQEGWLSTGNTRGIVGVTYTTSHTKLASDHTLHHAQQNTSGASMGGTSVSPSASSGTSAAPPLTPPNGRTGGEWEPPSRTNYNLRGHRAEVRSSNLRLIISTLVTVDITQNFTLIFPR